VGGNITCVRTGLSNPGRVIAAESIVGMLSSADGGRTWAQGAPGFSGMQINDCAVDPANDKVAYAATKEKGVYRTKNGGALWEEANVGITTTWMLSVAIDPVNTKRLYAGTMDWNNYTNGIVYISDDAGDSWHNYGKLEVEAATWVEMRKLAVDYSNTQRVFCATDAGIFLSKDGGQNWQQSNNNLGSYDVISLAIDPSAPENVVSGTDGRGAYVSTDGGGNWVQRFDSVFNRDIVYDLSFSRTKSGLVYAGTTSGLLRSEDGGKSWVIYAGGLGGAKVLSVAVSPADDNVVYAGTDNSGVFLCKP
jgi:photosystem II stability/assembly factor-like uncharacterized protein